MKQLLLNTVVSPEFWMLYTIATMITLTSLVIYNLENLRSLEKSLNFGSEVLVNRKKIRNTKELRQEIFGLSEIIRMIFVAIIWPITMVILFFSWLLRPCFER